MWTSFIFYFGLPSIENKRREFSYENYLRIIYLRRVIEWELFLFTMLRYCDIAILRVLNSNSQIFSLKFIH